MLSDKLFQFCKSGPSCRQGNIITCGVIGAYAVVLAVNAYVYTSLSYITLNILKRFLNNNFSAAFTDVPFQTVGESPARRRRCLPPNAPSTPPPPSPRLHPDHRVGGAGRGRRGPAAPPRAGAPLLPAQPLPHVAAGAGAAQDQRAGPEPPLPLAAQPAPGPSAAADPEEGAGGGAHASAPLTPHLGNIWTD